MHVITNMDLEVYEGDFTVIMGPSGSGKSTLLYALSAMDSATSGEVLFEDKNIVGIKEKEIAKLRYDVFGFVFQQIHLVSNLSLFENITVSGYLNTKNNVNDVKKRAEELMAQMEILEVKDHLPSQVSGGQQQRCAIARAVINQPKLIFADEPTGALNRKNTIEVLNLLSKLNENGQSILMVTHDIKAALRANRILYLEDGKIVGELSLPPYSKADEKNREIQVNSWLSSMHW